MYVVIFVRIQLSLSNIFRKRTGYNTPRVSVLEPSDVFTKQM